MKVAAKTTSPSPRKIALIALSSVSTTLLLAAVVAVYAYAPDVPSYGYAKWLQVGWAMYAAAGIAMAASFALSSAIILKAARKKGPTRHGKNVLIAAATCSMAATLLAASFLTWAPMPSEVQAFRAGASITDQIAVEDGLILWRGPIQSNSPDHLRAMIKGRPTPEGGWNLVLTNNLGGSAAGAWSVVDSLEELGIGSVTVSGICASACATVWVAAKNRKMAAGSAIGMHAPFHMVTKGDGPRQEVLGTIPDHEGKIWGRMAAEMREAGLSQAVVSAVSLTGPAELIYLTAADMEGAVEFDRVAIIKTQTTQKWAHAVTGMRLAIR